MFERLRWLLRRPDPVVQEWEWYARRHRREQGDRPLGDEWNVPEVLGVEVAADEIVSHIDRSVLEPWLGKVGTLLEIGSGGGRFTEALLPRAERLIATDTAPTMLELLQRRFQDRPGVSCVLLEGTNLAVIADGSVDAVFAYDVFVHLSAWNILLYLQEIARVLRPGGRAILHHSNLHSELGWKRFLRDAARMRDGQPPSARFTPMTPELMAEMATRSGFEVLAARTDIVPRDCITVLARPKGSQETGGTGP